MSKVSFTFSWNKSPVFVSHTCITFFLLLVLISALLHQGCVFSIFGDQSFSFLSLSFGQLQWFWSLTSEPVEWVYHSTFANLHSPPHSVFLSLFFSVTLCVCRSNASLHSCVKQHAYIYSGVQMAETTSENASILH